MAGKIRSCEVCRRLISPGRLEAVSDTLLCEEHAAQIEKYGGEFIRTVVQERTSKASSLKRQHGSASIAKTRNHEALDRLRDEYEREKERPKG